MLDAKFTTNHILLFSPVSEITGATISSCAVTGEAGSETITFTMAQSGYHGVDAIQIAAY